MRRVLKYISFLAIFGIVVMAASCGEGYFVGPIGGSVGGPTGLVPQTGLGPTDFVNEDPTITGFYTDVWYIDPGRDSNDGPGGVLGPWFADSIQTMQFCGFTGFATNPPSANPLDVEVNITWPIMLSFMSQWYHRNSDGTRIQSTDIFGGLIWSSSSLDISFVSGPVQRVVAGGQVIYLVDRQTHPFQNTSLRGWSSPNPVSPGGFPSPQQGYISNRFNECGVVLLRALLSSGTPSITNALGGTISDSTDNPQVENLGSIPQSIGGGFTAVPDPTGTFGDIFAEDYRLAPVITPLSIGHTEQEAMIEFARHFGCLHAQLVAQAVGLNSGEVDTIMDPAQVVWQNGFAYSFIQNDLDNLSKVHLPGKLRDPSKP